MRAENNKIIQPIPKPIAEDVHLPSYFLKGLAANVIDPINIVFSFLNLESILNFYRSILLNKAASNFQTSTINSLFTTRAITKKDIVVQKKLLTAHFATGLDDALVHDVVISPAHSLHFKLKVRLENIVRLHTAIPMDLQKILCDFCMSEQFSLDYVFLISYLEKSFQKIIVAKLIKKVDNAEENYERLSATFSYFNPKQKVKFLNKLIGKLKHADCCVREDAITGLGAAFAYLNAAQKTDILSKLIEKLNDPHCWVKSTAITALGAVFVCLDVEQKKVVLDKLIEKLNDPHCWVKSTAITALGAVFVCLDVEQKKVVLDKPIEKLNDPNSGAARSAAITALGAVFADLDVEQKTLVLDKLIENLIVDSHDVRGAAITALGAVFVCLDVEQKKLVLDKLIKKSNGVDYQATITELGVVFAYLDCLVQKKAVLDELIKQLNVDWPIAAVAATALGTAFAYLDAEQKKVVLDILIAKLNNSEPMIRQAAKETLENIALNNVLSPMQKQLLLSHPKLTDAAKIKITQAVLNFISPCISINISATNRPQLTDALLAVNNIFYQDFLNPTETDLKLLKDEMTSLIRVTQESQSSVGLFSGVPADQQLMEYFKLPESLKARILLKEAFEFPDESVIEFEKSLRALMRVHTSLTAPLEKKGVVIM